MGNRFNTKGSVMLVVVVLLASLNWLAISSLNGGVYHLKMISNSTLDSFALQAAESSINSVLNEASGVAAKRSFLSTAMTGGIQVNCLQAGGLSIEEGYCTAEDFFVRPQNESGGDFELQSFAITVKKGVLPVPGYDVGVVSFHVFETIGIAASHDGRHAYGYANSQRWKRLGAAGIFEGEH